MRAAGGRASRAAAAARLRAQGLAIRQIAAALAVSDSYAGELLRDPDGSRARARKARYGGVCCDCGCRTDGSNGRERAPKRCAPCARAAAHEGRWWTRQRCIEALVRYEREHGGPPPARLLRDAARPPWLPCYDRLRRELGTLTAAAQLADMTPRPVGRPRLRKPPVHA